MKFIIEHMEPELSEWCTAEYGHIAQIMGKHNVMFTNLSPKQADKLRSFGEPFTKPVKQLNLKKACILDHNAKERMTKKDAEHFDYFIFGGILGNNPAEGRTKLLTKEMAYPTRNLGNKQFSTDTAVYVAKQLLKGKKLEDIRFIEEVEIQIDDEESMIIPFPYAVEDNKLIISDDLVEHIRKGGF